MVLPRVYPHGVSIVAPTLQHLFFHNDIHPCLFFLQLLALTLHVEIELGICTGTNGIIGMAVQLFFAWRVRTLTGNLFAVVPIVVLALVSCGPLSFLPVFLYPCRKFTHSNLRIILTPLPSIVS